MKGDYVSAVDHENGIVHVSNDGPPPRERFALQYETNGTWCWTCDAGGYVLPFDERTLAEAGELPVETRRVPWDRVPARLKRIADFGNRKARRAARSDRRREAWAAHKAAERKS